MEDWKLLTYPYNDDIKKVLHIQHLAAQFISITGRYLIPEKKDQDNITMQFVPTDEMFIGKQHPDGWMVSLLLTNLVLQLRDRNLTVAAEVLLEGKTFPEVLIEFKKRLHENDIDVSLLRTEQPYELPVEPLEKGLFFTSGPEAAISENIKYRYNANMLLNSIRSGFTGTSPVFIWPNHFDTGFSFPVEHNKDGEITKTIGMGWAIPDDMVNEPYYYLSLHAQEKLPLNNKPGKIPHGIWMMPKWNGAVLKLSEIIAADNAEEQMKMVSSFLETGVQRLTEHYKISQ